MEFKVMEPMPREEDDFISHMPDNVVTNILDRLELHDAVRTSVLSKTWRFKWTMLSQLVFDEDFSVYLSRTHAKDSQERVIVDRFLFHLRGAITKFYLSVFDDSNIEDEDISHWILFLARIGIKDLTIKLFEPRMFKLPTHIFSCLELKHLQLYNCFLYIPPNFHGFPNLLSLELDSDYEESGDYCELITRCPLLEILILSYSISCQVKVVEIAKLENLKILSLYLCDLDTSGTTFELLGSLPKLLELELTFGRWKVTEGGAKQRFFTAFPSLKTLKLLSICLDDSLKLSCAFELIGSCPNLHTLEITTGYWDDGRYSQIDYKYNTTGQLQLRSVMFRSLKGSENEMCLLKYILACSPFLKKIVIQPLKSMTSDEKLKFAMKLLKLHRASPDVNVDVDLF